MSAISRKGDVFLVDDDAAVQRGVSALLSAADYNTSAFKSAEEFLLKLPDLDLDEAVLLIDVCMPGIQGLELQERLRRESVQLPVIVMTAHGDIPMAVRAMQNGAVAFLQKPFTVDEVTTALERALSTSPRTQSPPQGTSPELESCFKSLTSRESDVFREIVSGNTNKEIARILEISPRTVEVHRQKIMAKMKAENLAELVRMAVSLNIGN